MIQVLTLHDPAATVITLCWLVFGIVWAVSALFVKRTIEQSLGWVRLLAFAVVIWVLARVSRVTGPPQSLWPGTALLGALAALLTVAGLVVAVWARAVLGRNWSGTVAFKEGHELIERGPYAYVRHPIYSGLLLMGLGTAIERARLESFLMLAMALVGLAIKAQFEEQLMIRHFPEAYPQYRRRVKALIPGVW
jgi:protein-S-isoprenylcysteine O-methyltransferase Ste14